MIWIICMALLAAFHYADSSSLALRPLAFEPLHLLTSSLAHKDMTHLLFNFATLLPAGLLFERKHGPIALLGFSIVTGGVSTLCEYWSDIAYPGTIMGASGVACGLLGSLALYSPFTRSLSLLLLGFFIGSVLDPADKTIAHYGHLSGYVCGLFWAILSNVEIKVYRTDRF